MEFTARPHAKFCLARMGNRKSIWSGLTGAVGTPLVLSAPVPISLGSPVHQHQDMGNKLLMDITVD